MKKFSYAATSCVQVKDGKQLILFSAPAHEILLWGGIPQKKNIGAGVESAAGFQRDESKSRLKSIATFLKDPRNTIQNPLLCTIRDSADCLYSFNPIDKKKAPGLGYFTIEMPTFSDKSLLELFEMVKVHLESRIPDLLSRKVSDKIISKVQSLARESGIVQADEEDASMEEQDIDTPYDSEDEGAVAIFNESHIVEFWEEVAARKIVLENIGDYPYNEFLGFPREVLEDYLKPVVVVDGQHRLKGAILIAQILADEPSARELAEQLIEKGKSPEEVEERLLLNNVRNLPVSLLLDPDPAEHVFQFVVVNQKATPIGRALLGTIVSTSLTNEELGGVSSRLKDAGIPLEESRAATFMARFSDSPFAGLVDLGLTPENVNTKLPWAVFVSLVNLFRELQGATLYHIANADYAADWRRHYLSSSGLVANHEAAGFDDPLSYWSSFDGPWKEIFIIFWTEIRDRFSNQSNEEKFNYWGNPRHSNLFNKVSLNILAADFFSFLNADRSTIENIEHFRFLIGKWLDRVDKGYFDRDWELTGIKKDDPNTRKKWAKLWTGYRVSPGRLPNRDEYRKTYTA